MNPKVINFYTDGAYSPVTQTGGWAVYCPELKLKVTSQERGTTNNRMEMTAAIKALEFAFYTKLPVDMINIYSDSMYVINTMKGLYAQKTNTDLWRRLGELVSLISARNLKINWIHVKGHAGHVHNEVVDRLANLLSQTTLRS